MSLVNHAKPISEVLQDERTSPRIRKLLSEVEPVKKYGESNGLKSNKNYTEYVKLDRSAAVWVVSASKPLRFFAKEWKFPVVGSFPYLGWFDLKSARDYGETLKKEGWDVDVRGASAYSTLGWFRDAVLSTMIPEGDEALGALVNVVLHESVHATVYIKGQSNFNESLASFVADRMTLDYLEKVRGLESAERRAFQEAEKKQRVYERAFHLAYQQLDEIYHSSKLDSEKTLQKEAILAKLKADLAIQREINNATLIQYKTYHSGSEAFESLLKRCGNRWTDFLLALKTLSVESFPQSQMEDPKSVLDRLLCTVG